MPTIVSFTGGPCPQSGSRLLTYLSCKRPLGLFPVTGKRARSVLQRRQFQQHEQCRLGHSWVSGHPHSVLYKPSTSANKIGTSVHNSSPTGCGAGLGGSHGGAGGGSGTGSSSSTSSFPDFAGNSRYQAYSLARFSTFSAAASSSPISPAPSSKQDRDSDASRNHEDRAHSNPALEDNQSEPASSSTTSSSAVTSSTAAKNRSDEKEDDWAVNECYSGHSNHDFSPSSSSSSSSFPSTSTSDSSPDMSSLSPTSPLIPITSDDTFIDNDANSGYESRALGPSPSSFKSASAIQASWRRTSESLPSVVVPEGTPALASKPPNTAGGLDLSSSTLVQQMLFQERAPHVDSSEQANQVDEEVDRSAEVLPATEPVATTSPTLTSMMLNQSMVDSSPPGELVALPPIVPNHTTSKKIEQDGEEFIEKLDIRVGIVRSVARHPDAESLYIEQVDVGDKEGDVHKESRTIVSGLVRHVPQEYLEGRAVIVVGNMKPSKLRGVISEGMLLCAMEQDLNGVVTKVGLLEPAEGSQAGDKVTFEGYTDEGTIPAPVLTPKRKWFEKTQAHFSVKDGVAYYKGSPFRTVKGLVRCKSIVEGQIS